MNLWRRFTARRGMCLFVDCIDRREVWSFVCLDGSQYMGQSRFGLWVERNQPAL